MAGFQDELDPLEVLTAQPRVDPLEELRKQPDPLEVLTRQPQFVGPPAPRPEERRIRVLQEIDRLDPRDPRRAALQEEERRLAFGEVEPGPQRTQFDEAANQEFRREQLDAQARIGALRQEINRVSNDGSIPLRESEAVIASNEQEIRDIQRHLAARTADEVNAGRRPGRLTQLGGGATETVFEGGTAVQNVAERLGIGAIADRITAALTGVPVENVRAAREEYKTARDTEIGDEITRHTPPPATTGEAAAQFGGRIAPHVVAGLASAPVARAATAAAASRGATPLVSEAAGQLAQEGILLPLTAATTDSPGEAAATAVLGAGAGTLLSRGLARLFRSGAADAPRALGGDELGFEDALRGVEIVEPDAGVQAAKRTAKAAVQAELSAGRLTSQHVFRGTNLDELEAIAREGKLQVGESFEGRPGISGALIGDGSFPVYGDGVGILAPRNVVSPSGRSGEMLIDEATDPRNLRYVVGGKVVRFEELPTAINRVRAGEATIAGLIKSGVPEAQARRMVTDPAVAARFADQLEAEGSPELAAQLRFIAGVEAPAKQAESGSLRTQLEASLEQKQKGGVSQVAAASADPTDTLAALRANHLKGMLGDAVSDQDLARAVSDPAFAEELAIRLARTGNRDAANILRESARQPISLGAEAQNKVLHHLAERMKGTADPEQEYLRVMADLLDAQGNADLAAAVRAELGDPPGGNAQSVELLRGIVRADDAQQVLRQLQQLGIKNAELIPEDRLAEIGPVLRQLSPQERQEVLARIAQDPNFVGKMKTGDKAEALWYASRLAFPTTHMRNLIGNAVNMTELVTTRPVEAAFDSARVAMGRGLQNIGIGHPLGSALVSVGEVIPGAAGKLLAAIGEGLRGDIKRRIFFREMGSFYNSLPAAWQLAKLRGREAWRHGMTLSQREALATQQEVALRQHISQVHKGAELGGAKALPHDFVRDIQVDPLGEKVERALFDISKESPLLQKLTAPLRALAAEDDLVRGMAIGMDHEALAARIALQEGHQGEALAQRINQLLEHPTPKLREMFTKTGQRVTFTESNALADWLSNLRERGPAGRVTKLAIAPFSRVTSNILRRVGYEYTPLNALSVLARTAEGDTEGAITAFTRMSLGSLAWLSFYGIAMDDRLSGAGPRRADGNPDWDAIARLRETGWQPYSIRVGNTWYSYRNISHLSGLAAAAAFLYETTDLGGEATEEGFVEFLERAGMSHGKAAIEEAPFESILTLMAAIMDNDEREFERQAVFMFSPVPPLGGQIERAIDPTVRSPETLGERIRVGVGLGGPIGEAFGFEPVSPAVDFAGGEAQRPQSTLSRLTNPLQPSSVQYDEPAQVVREFQRLKEMGHELNVGAFPNVRFEGKEREEFLRAWRAAGFGAARDVMANPNYMRESDEGKVDWLNDEIRAARAAVNEAAKYLDGASTADFTFDQILREAGLR